MNTEDDEFRRIEMEQRIRQNALQQLHDENKRLGLYEGVYPSIPFVTAEEWEALNAQEK
jgi:hypothetical protein